MSDKKDAPAVSRAEALLYGNEFAPAVRAAGQAATACERAMDVIGQMLTESREADSFTGGTRDAEGRSQHTRLLDDMFTLAHGMFEQSRAYYEEAATTFQREFQRWKTPDYTIPVAFVPEEIPVTPQTVALSRETSTPIVGGRADTLCEEELTPHLQALKGLSSVFVCGSERTALVATRILGSSDAVFVNPYVSPDGWEIRTVDSNPATSEKTTS